MKHHRTSLSSWVRALTLPAALLSYASTAQAVPLLSSDLASFAVLGAAAVTNVPTSTIVGNLGVSAGSSLTGFNSSPGVATADPQITGGSLHTTTALAAQAQSDLTTARTNLGLLGPGSLLSADLMGLTIFPGIYTVPASISNLTGAVTLDGQGNANAVWVFQMPSTLILSAGSTVNVINTGAGAGVFWNVGSSATLDTAASFQGNILALTSITMKTGATIGCGRALADNGAVALDMNTIGIGCDSNGFSGGLTLETGASGETPTFLPFSPVATAVPEPGTLTLLAVGLAGLGLLRRRKAT